MSRANRASPPKCGTLLEVREALLRHTWFITWQVEYAGIDELSFAVPADIADDLQIEGADIKERTKLRARSRRDDSDMARGTAGESAGQLHAAPFARKPAR